MSPDAVHAHVRRGKAGMGEQAIVCSLWRADRVAVQASEMYIVRCSPREISSLGALMLTTIVCIQLAS